MYHLLSGNSKMRRRKGGRKGERKEEGEEGGGEIILAKGTNIFLK